METGAQNDELEIVPLEAVEEPKPHLPPPGQLLRPQIIFGDIMYVMSGGSYGEWLPAKVLALVEVASKSGPSKCFSYKVRFTNYKTKAVKVVSRKQMAYPNPAQVILNVGVRVIALFKDEWPTDSYFAGVVAERPKPANGYRYLVFFDDGYAQYVTHEEIRVICESSHKVWEDMLPDSREFVKNYLVNYPERPMLKLKEGQIVRTEWNGTWWIARVAEVDGSLVKMCYDADGRTEWIYRGSPRLNGRVQHQKQSGSSGRARKRRQRDVEMVQESDGKRRKVEQHGQKNGRGFFHM